jgi:hypothetical protein
MQVGFKFGSVNDDGAEMQIYKKKDACALLRSPSFRKKVVRAALAAHKKESYDGDHWYYGSKAAGVRKHAETVKEANEQGYYAYVHDEHGKGKGAVFIKPSGEIRRPPPTESFNRADYSKFVRYCKVKPRR